MTRSPSSATIERIVSGGWGLTHIGSLATFVRGTLPGEQVTLTPGEIQRGYQIATLASVETSSPDRIVPACSKFGVCGGCQFQHVRYEAQLRQKADIVRETFARIGQVNALTLLPTVPSPFPYEYRRWVRFSVFPQDDGYHLGFRQEHSHRSIAGTECLLIPEAVRSVVDHVESRLSQIRNLPMPLSHVEIRSSGSFGNHLVIFRGEVWSKRQARELLELFHDLPTVHGLVVTSLVAGGRRPRKPVRVVQGEEYLFERFGELVFRISDRSFMQANWAVYEIIQQSLLEWIGACMQLRILELFAGVGCLGLSLARQGALVTEVEGNSVAVADARKSASINHIGRCRFRSATAERFLGEVGPDDYDVIIVDPPRPGLSKDCTESLVSLHVPRLYYLSCDVPSLARDVNRLCGRGYRLGRVQIFDMFPQTAHVETLVELLAE